MEVNNGAVAKKGTDEVVVMISGSGGEVEKPGSSSENLQSGHATDPDPELKEVENVALKVQVPNPNSSSFGQGFTEPRQTPSDQPPMVPTGTLTRRKSSLTRSPYSTPKSRLVEQLYPSKAESAKVKSQLKSASSPSKDSPSVASPGAHVSSANLNEYVKTAPATPRTPILVSLGGGNDEDDDEEVYKTANLEVQKISDCVFEAIIFVFVMHPFDVGDRCVIDGVQMVVEEMNILTTVFLRYDNGKIYYPNSVLATKPTSNFYRSPEISDSVEFAIDFFTSIESIGDMKAKIKEYLESKPQYWRPGHSVLAKEIEDVNKMKMGLYVTHTINFQKSGDRSSRRCKLVLELKKILKEVGIAYRLLPQDVHLSNVGSPSSAAAGPT